MPVPISACRPPLHHRLDQLFGIKRGSLDGRLGTGFLQSLQIILPSSVHRSRRLYGKSGSTSPRRRSAAAETCGRTATPRLDNRRRPTEEIQLCLGQGLPLRQQDVYRFDVLEGRWSSSTSRCAPNCSSTGFRPRRIDLQFQLSSRPQSRRPHRTSALRDSCPISGCRRSDLAG